MKSLRESMRGSKTLLITPCLNASKKSRKNRKIFYAEHVSTQPRMNVGVMEVRRKSASAVLTQTIRRARRMNH